MHNINIYNYFNIDNLEYNINLNSNKENLAVLILGELRTFYLEIVYNSFIDLLNKFKNKFKKIVIFFYISLDATQHPWYYDYYLNRNNLKREELSYNQFNEKLNKFKKTKQEFKKFISNIEFEYIIYFRNSNEDDINFKRYGLMMVQNIYIQECLKLVSLYENENKIKFDFIFKSRPDIIYNI